MHMRFLWPATLLGLWMLVGQDGTRLEYGRGVTHDSQGTVLYSSEAECTQRREYMIMRHFSAQSTLPNDIERGYSREVLKHLTGATCQPYSPPEN